ncbi:hypothetical protein [Streptomyces sp. NPDC089919]|uniref:hypothetical protein n=1 Tax=Streptomyces sp. NPDC089919 TaxID=3155188 RepID=UPI00343BE9E1
MSNARRVRRSLASAVLGLGAVAALASTAGAATPADAPRPATAVSTPAQTQDLPLSDGSIAHVSTLGDGRYQAWVTFKGTRIAALDAAHATARVHGKTYVLNQANGFVGVVEASGWHSESDVARPDRGRAPKGQSVGTTRDRAHDGTVTSHR